MSDRPTAAPLGSAGAMALVSGSMLGIGIFIGPPQTAANVSSAASLLGLWALGGVVALCGALCLSELGAMRPRAGGDYVYLRWAHGDGVAFAAGWLQLLAIFPGSLATMALATASYQLPVLLGEDWGGALSVGTIEIPVPTLVGLALLLGLTGINHLGLGLSAKVQLSFTAIPVVALAAAASWVLLSQPPATVPPVPADEGTAAGAGLAAAYLPVYFAYSGWYAALFVGSEVKRPQRSLPLALLGGTALIALLYLLICAALLRVFSVAELAGSGEAGTAAARQLFGAAGAEGMALLIFCAMLSSINGTLATGSRIAQAMARDGLCFGPAARTSPGRGTPVVALWFQFAVSAALLLTGSMAESLLDYTVSAMLVTTVLSVGAMLRLRRREPKTPRPFRAPLAPLLGAVALLSCLTALLLLSVQGHPSTLFALAWFAGALALHRLVLKPRR